VEGERTTSANVHDDRRPAAGADWPHGAGARPEVPERPWPPRQYPAAYKLRILAKCERLGKAGKGALAALGQGQHRGRPPVDPKDRALARLERDNARLRDQLERAMHCSSRSWRPEGPRKLLVLLCFRSFQARVPCRSGRTVRLLYRLP
jgi:hypothetical protein